MKIGDESFDVAAAREPRTAQRHLNLPRLIRIPRLGGPINSDELGVSPGSGLERAATRFKLIESPIDAHEIERLARRMPHRLIMRGKVRNQRPGRSECCAGFGDVDRPATQTAADGDAAKSGRAPPSDKSGRRRVNPLTQCNIEYRLHHILVCELKDRGGGGFDTLPRGACDLA